MDLTIGLNYQERDVIAACINKERWAQQEIYKEYYGRMMALCIRYSNDKEDAYDILHDGFIKVFNNINKYEPNTSLYAWIYRIMVNTSIDYYRKSLKRKTDDLDTVYNVSNDEVDIVSKCSENDILEAIQQLSPSYRMVFNMFAIEGYSHKEIGDLLNITESTSRSNLVKARGKLQLLLSEKYYGYGK
jgi:RNA polymerase sigma factor (sigma-70 family)